MVTSGITSNHNQKTLCLWWGMIRLLCSEREGSYR
jgi:hypothetical protein